MTEEFLFDVRRTTTTSPLNRCQLEFCVTFVFRMNIYGLAFHLAGGVAQVRLVRAENAFSIKESGHQRTEF